MEAQRQAKESAAAESKLETASDVQPSASTEKEKETATDKVIQETSSVI